MMQNQEDEKRRTAKGWNDPPSLDELKAANPNGFTGNSRGMIGKKYRYPEANMAPTNPIPQATSSETWPTASNTYQQNYPNYNNHQNYQQNYHQPY